MSDLIGYVANGMIGKVERNYLFVLNRFYKHYAFSGAKTESPYLCVLCDFT